MPYLRPSPAKPPWHNWYLLKRWKLMRHAQLLKDHYTCRICKVMTHHSSQLICDHVIPHRGDPTLFWQGELQTLCATCHSSTKQALERTGKTKHTTGQDGWPIS